MLENLHDEILKSRSPRLCTVGAFYAKLSDDDKVRLDALLENEEILASEIAQAMLPHIRIAAPTWARHRRRAAGNGCGCP